MSLHTVIWHNLNYCFIFTIMSLIVMLLCVYMYYTNVYSIFKCLASNDVLCNVLIWANKKVSYLILYVNTLHPTPVDYMGRAKLLPAPAPVTFTGKCSWAFVSLLELSFQSYHWIRVSFCLDTALPRLNVDNCAHGSFIFIFRSAYQVKEREPHQTKCKMRFCWHRFWPIWTRFTIRV